LDAVFILVTAPMHSLRVTTVTDVPNHHHLDKRAAHLIAAASAGDPGDLLTTKQMATWLGVSVQWLEIGRTKGYGPPFVKLAPRKMVRYRRGDVQAWLAARVHASTAEYRG
jgi:hypothetical protein